MYDAELKTEILVPGNCLGRIIGKKGSVVSNIFYIIMINEWQDLDQIRIPINELHFDAKSLHFENQMSTSVLKEQLIRYTGSLFREILLVVSLLRFLVFKMDQELKSKYQRTNKEVLKPQFTLKGLLAAHR